MSYQRIHKFNVAKAGTSGVKIYHGEERFKEAAKHQTKNSFIMTKKEIGELSGTSRKVMISKDYNYLESIMSNDFKPLTDEFVHSYNATRIVEGETFILQGFARYRDAKTWTEDCNVSKRVAIERNRSKCLISLDYNYITIDSSDDEDSFTKL